MIINEISPDFIPAGARIKVIGIGGAGVNSVNRMIEEGIAGVDFIAANTDAQSLANSLAKHTITLGMNITKGLGAGGNPDIGRKAAEESLDQIKELIRDTDMVFITTGMGGGTGTGAAPVIAQAAKEMGILTVGVVTKPFSFEGQSRFQKANEGIARMKTAVDTLIIIPNDKIFNIIDKKTSFKQAFVMIDKILLLGVQGITDLIVKPGIINIDFADIKAVMSGSGTALIGIGYAEGENRAVEAARKAVENPLLDAQLHGARSIIFSITGNNDLTPAELQEAAKIIQEIASDDVSLKFGMTYDDSFDGEVKVTVIATGFDDVSQDSVIKPAARDVLGRKMKAEDFVSRSMRTASVQASEQQRQPEPVTHHAPSFNSSEEDLETPAFLRKKLGK